MTAAVRPTFHVHRWSLDEADSTTKKEGRRGTKIKQEGTPRRKHRASTSSNASQSSQLSSVGKWRLEQQVQAALHQPVPRNLGELVVDPNGMLEKVDLMSPKAFWQWFHLPDREDSGSRAWLSRADSLWGEALWPYILENELVLAVSIPMVLEKAEAYSGQNFAKSKRLAETKAMLTLREHLAKSDAASIGGLIITMSGMIHVSIQNDDFSAALTHLGAIRRMMDSYTPKPTEWLCCSWSDLRTVSSISVLPCLPRSVPEEWQHDLGLPSETFRSCQRLAWQNVRALGHLVEDQTPKVHGIMRRLHELQNAMDSDQSAVTNPIGELYQVVYDTCELHAYCRNPETPPTTATSQMELIAIALKLCAWERCATLVPRCGEVERHMLHRAGELLESQGNVIDSWKTNASIQSWLWVLLALTATSYGYCPDMWPRLLALWPSALATADLNTWSALRKMLKGFPCFEWWYTPVARKVLENTSPEKRSWRVLDSDVPSCGSSGFLKCLMFGD